MERTTEGAGDARAAVTLPEPVAAAIQDDGKGGWYLQLHYTGLLAGYDPVWVRLGEHRHGAEWLNVRDVEMEHFEGEETVARITFPPGEPPEAVELAFWAEEDPNHPVWDNAGHPFGYYEMDGRTGDVEPH